MVINVCHCQLFRQTAFSVSIIAILKRAVGRIKELSQHGGFGMFELRLCRDILTDCRGDGSAETSPI